MGERDDAHRSIEDARERMSEIAEELARRANPDRLRAKAKEEAVKRSRELRDQAVSRGKDFGDRALSNPMAVGTLGAVIGSVTGALIAKGYEKSSIHERASQPGWGGYQREGYGESAPYESGRYGQGRGDVLIDEETIFPAGAAESVQGHESGVVAGEGRSGELHERGEAFKERASGKGQEIKERVAGKGQELKERASEKSHELRDRLSSRGHDLGERASHLREHLPTGGELRSRGMGLVHRAERNPAALVIGGIVLGSIAALLLPVTQAERRRVEPVKEKARESIRSATEQLEERAFGGGGEEESEEPRIEGEAPRTEYQPPTVH